LQSTLDGELNIAVNLGEQGVILAQTNVFTSVETGTALTNDNGTCRNQFATVSLNAQAFGFESRPLRELPPAFLCAMTVYPYFEIASMRISVKF
jgi:hypothetical protein